VTFIDQPAAKIDFESWNAEFRRFGAEAKTALSSPAKGGPVMPVLSTPQCFVELEGNLRLRSLRFDNSLASLRLWSFLLSENDRLVASRRAGKKIIGTLKDLGTIPVIVYSSSRAVAFYPDGAWWIPCLMEMSEGLLRIADAAGFGDEVCPVRATLAAFLNQAHFPTPDLLVAAAGACCDDMSCVMQRVADLGLPMVWWELPYRRGAVTPELVRFVEPSEPSSGKTSPTTCSAQASGKPTACAASSPAFATSPTARPRRPFRLWNLRSAKCWPYIFARTSNNAWPF